MSIPTLALAPLIDNFEAIADELASVVANLESRASYLDGQYPAQAQAASTDVILHPNSLLEQLEAQRHRIAVSVADLQALQHRLSETLG